MNRADPRAGLVVTAMLALGGCGGQPKGGLEQDAGGSGGTAQPDWLTPALVTPGASGAAKGPGNAGTHARIDGIAGEPIAVLLDETVVSAGRVRIRLDDGTDVPVKTYQIQVKAGPTVDPWMGPSGEWTAEPAAPSKNAPTLAVFTLPRQAAGQGLWIGENRRDVQWLAPPEAIAGAESSAAWKPTLPPAGAGNPSLMARLREAAKSPLSRWRVRLLLDGMRSAVPPTRFDDPVVEAWAMYIEQRWRIAFARLAIADAGACERLRTRLSAVVDFGGGVYAPAWPTDERTLDQLLHELLSPTGPSGGVTGRTEQFLAEQPQGVVWVVDDGGVLSGGNGPDRRPLPLIGIANFTGRDALAFGYMGEEPTRPDLVPAKAYSAQILTILGVGTGPTATVRLSRWTANVPVAIAPLPVTPPGLTIGPLVPDLSMERWLYAQPALAPPSLTTTALLHRPVPGPDGDRRWELFIECRVPAGGVGEDRVCVCMGPPGMPGGVVCVGRDGVVSTRLSGPEDAGPPLVLPVAQGADRWSFRLSLPPSAIEQGGRVRLGMLRQTGMGRFEWPRPLLPWQEFPSRALIDLSGWTGFDAPER